VAAALIGGSAELVADKRLAIDDLVPAPLARRVAEMLGESGSPAAGAMALRYLVNEGVGGSWEPDHVVEHTVACLRAGRRLPEVGLSARQHRRRFAQAMGYGPKFFERICRLDRFTERVGQASLAELAARLGYFDQAHLTRDCVALTGRTPAQFRADRFVQDTCLEVV
jgi:hypothetical protein